MRVHWIVTFAFLFGLVLQSGGVASAETAVDFFDAINQDRIHADFIPIDSTTATVIVTNVTDRELLVLPPKSFVGIAVLAQLGLGGPGQQQGQQGQGQNGGGGQSVGGGGAGQNQGIGQGQQGNNQNGFFRIPPGKTIRWKAITVCLQHGRPEPNPRMKYQIVPADSFTQDARVVELCRRVGSGNASQSVGQAAAWHLASDLPWDQIETMNRIESKYTGNVRYFTDAEIASAKRLVEVVVSQVVAPELVSTYDTPNR
jgi:hypothetical protein